jgi:hypothetical protein
MTSSALCDLILAYPWSLDSPLLYLILCASAALTLLLFFSHDRHVWLFLSLSDNTHIHRHIHTQVLFCLSFGIRERTWASHMLVRALPLVFVFCFWDRVLLPLPGLASNSKSPYLCSWVAGITRMHFYIAHCLASSTKNVSHYVLCLEHTVDT